MNTKPLEGEVITNNKGQFVEGKSGNPRGRPKGSKNKVTLYKLQIEEAFRSRNDTKIQMVLDTIVAQALDGDKASQKLVWDACISKAQVAEDKSAGAKQQITVHRMSVVQNQDEDDSDG